MFAVAEMYIKGVSTRQTKGMLRDIGVRSTVDVGWMSAETSTAFPESLLARCMHGTTFIVSDDYAG
jgi:hypothetical protein